MMIHLYNIDKNWQKRGYMENYNLIVNFYHRTYRTYISPYYWYENRDDIQVAKKSDILEYEKMLEANWFQKVEEF